MEPLVAIAVAQVGDQDDPDDPQPNQEELLTVSGFHAEIVEIKK